MICERAAERHPPRSTNVPREHRTEPSATSSVSAFRRRRWHSGPAAGAGAVHGEPRFHAGRVVCVRAGQRRRRRLGAAQVLEAHRAEHRRRRHARGPLLHQHLGRHCLRCTSLPGAGLRRSRPCPRRRQLAGGPPRPPPGAATCPRAPTRVTRKRARPCPASSSGPKKG